MGSFVLSESEHKIIPTKSDVASISGGAGGLAWLLALYVFATWVAIGSLCSIQFRDEIIQKHHTTYLQVNEFSELSERIRFMRTFGYTPMLVMPDQALTLLLAMAMGVLGSTITMTWTFLEENQNPSVKWYLLRPFVGALSALVIFIFAKAGQMTLTVNAADVNLSPFLLSLLGVASGCCPTALMLRCPLLAENLLAISMSCRNDGQVISRKNLIKSN